MSWWERQSEGRLLGSPGPWLAAFSPGWMCRGSQLPAGSGSLAQVAPGVKHSSALLALGLLRKEVSELAHSLSPSSSLLALRPFFVTCHQLWT